MSNMRLSRRRFAIPLFAILTSAGAAAALAACESDPAVEPTPDASTADARQPEGDATPPPPAKDSAVPPNWTATKDSARTARDVSVVIDVLANDTAPKSAALVVTMAPKKGTVVVGAGKLTYTPNEGADGDDTFEYIASEGGRDQKAEVAVTVLPSPGTVVHGQLYSAESADDITWADINAAGDRVGKIEKGADRDKIAVVTKAGVRTIIAPPGPAEDQLVRGIADDGTVLAQYLHATRFQFIGFTWKAGVVDRTCDPGAEGDCTLERMRADGTIVGNTYDYTLYTGFVWPAGKSRVPLAVTGYASTYATAIDPSGVVLGIGDNSSDGYSGPQRCFRGTPVLPTSDAGTDGGDAGDAGATRGLTVLPFTASNPHFVYCRGINASGAIVGAVKALPDGAGKPRSETDRIKAALWHPQKGFAYVRLPYKRPTAASWRVEQLFGINASGVIVGTFQDATPAAAPTDGGAAAPPTRVTRGVTLTPIEALPGTSFADTIVDHVDGPI